jgi:hypothetical protein
VGSALAKHLHIVGFHFVGRNAGEITQPFALALRVGATKADLDATVRSVVGVGLGSVVAGDQRSRGHRSVFSAYGVPLHGGWNFKVSETVRNRQSCLPSSQEYPQRTA